MERKYTLVLITDLYGNMKTRTEDTARIGRVFSIDDSGIIINSSYLMKCIKPGFLKSVVTSRVKDVIKAEDGIIIITENSKYYLVYEEMVLMT